MSDRGLAASAALGGVQADIAKSLSLLARLDGHVATEDRCGSRLAEDQAVASEAASEAIAETLARVDLVPEAFFAWRAFLDRLAEANRAVPALRPLYAYEAGSQEVPQDRDCWVYGEALPLTVVWVVAEALQVVRSPRAPDSLIFLDLGSGSGMAVCAVAAAFPHTFQRCRGVELMLSRCARASEVSAELQAQAQCRGLVTAPVHLQQGDIAAPQCAAGADLVYVTLTAFNSEFRKQMTRALAEQLTVGAVVITTSYQLSGCGADSFEVLWSRWGEFSWGGADIHIHRRVAPR